MSEMRPRMSVAAAWLVLALAAGAGCGDSGGGPEAAPKPGVYQALDEMGTGGLVESWLVLTLHADATWHLGKRREATRSRIAIEAGRGGNWKPHGEHHIELKTRFHDAILEDGRLGERAVRDGGTVLARVGADWIEIPAGGFTKGAVRLLYDSSLRVVQEDAPVRSR